MKTKEMIFESALYLFSEHGFNASTIRQITERAGVTPGAFYNHFASKDELLKAVYDYYTTQCIQPQETDGDLADYKRFLAQHGPAALFEHITRSYLQSMRNEKLLRLTKIILMEQYTNAVAGEIAFRDRQRLLRSMEALFVLMDNLKYISVKDPQYTGRLLGYVYLGFSADNIYCYFLAGKDPDEIASRQLETVLRFLDDILILKS
ncbi:MAG: TetR/AcrR family transcriptional regulator [Clostridiales bacterium]|nr:TetR/AcrR family transcriptional regulator [Clostridiales bacterium]